MFLFGEIETAQGREEPAEMMDINHDSEIKFEKSDDHETELKTDHLIGTSVHEPQRLMVTYTGMGTVGPGSHGLLRN
ncbi:hypothetical protein TNCV_3015381 [Trichonephila clavipes]|nr:hypothetical protein TNCV_3015381 [Trichonephila clavipes]